MPVPDGIDVKRVEKADACVHMIPPASPGGGVDLFAYKLGFAAVATWYDIGLWT